MVPGAIDVNIDHINDSIRIGDGTDLLTVNPDGSINVVVQDSGIVSNLVSKYSEITAVASGSQINVVTYTVPAGMTAFVQKINVAATNIGIFEVLINGIVQDKGYTYFSGGMNLVFDFKEGLPLVATDNVVVRAVSNRPDPSNFNGRIQVLEIL
jgi:hypothetical protein